MSYLILTFNCLFLSGNVKGLKIRPRINIFLHEVSILSMTTNAIISLSKQSINCEDMVSFALALRAEQPFWWTFPGTLSLTVPEKRNMCSDRSMEVKLPVPCGNYSRQTDRPTNRATNRLTATADKGAHREVTLPIIKKFKRLILFRKSWWGGWINL